MNIPQPDRGENGESAGVVNQWLRLGPVDLREFARTGHVPICNAFAWAKLACPAKLLHQILNRIRFSMSRRNSFDCATRQSLGRSGLATQGKTAMIETVTALLGLISAGIFLAHAFEGFRARA
jgi:hypothetical protein